MTDNVTSIAQFREQERITQGDILKNIEYIEYYKEEDGNFALSKIIFPYVIVLTQDCDLEQYSDKFYGNNNHDKFLLSILVAPLYNSIHLFDGKHLEEFEEIDAMQRQNSAKKKQIKQNNIERYHYLEFTKKIETPDSVIDFKHYFTVNSKELREKYSEKYVCSITELFRERVSQRFANYLSRIGLPELSLR